MPSILQTKLLSEFSCLGDRCSDTCCKGWSMQVDDATLARYKNNAPELLGAVEQSADAPWIMRKDTAGACVKLEGGLCGIHKKYGDGFLSDACHFYPRVTRRLGDRAVMTATLSCPEIARLALVTPRPSALKTVEIERLPQSMKDYLPAGMTSADALTVHDAFLQAAQDEGATAEQIFLRVATVSRFLERIDKKSWAQAVGTYFKTADALIPAAEININDPFNVLHALCGLIVASKKPMSERLQQTVSDMEHALDVTLDWQQAQIQTGDNSLSAYRQARQLWQQQAAAIYAPMLRQWLHMQLSAALYPFSGLGNTPEERITIIGVRLATLKLAFLSNYVRSETPPSQETAVRVMQSLSRLLDHLGDPAFSLQIYAETGWIRESRMRGLLEA